MAANGRSRSFSVKSGGHCFLCLSKVPPQLLTSVVKVEPGGDGESDFQSVSEFYPEYSLQYLSHYLKLNLEEKVFDDEEQDEFSASQQSLPLMTRLGRKWKRLDVVLCEGCAELNGRFSDLYQQLERIEMEVTQRLNSIHQCLHVKAEKEALKDCLVRKDVGILETVRKEVMRKCSSKLRRATPRVEVEKLNRKYFNFRKQNVAGGASQSQSGEVAAEEAGQVTAASVFKMEIDLEASQQSDIAIPAHETEANIADFSTVLLNEITEPNLDDFMPGDEAADHDDTSSTENQANVSADPALPKKDVGNKSFELNPDTGMLKCMWSSCEMEFADISSARAHYHNVHLSCDICGKEYPQNRKYNLTKHYLNVHLKIDRRPYPCNECGKVYTDPSALRKHRQSVHLKLDMRRFPCDTCGKKFFSRAILKAHHQNVHLRMKPYRCDDCGLEFGQLCHLKRHRQTIHLKFKPHRCDKCDKRFSQKSDLKTHQLTVHRKLSESKQSSDQ